MKKVALLLAAAMLALAGCASAGDTAAASEAAPAESTAESAAAEDSTEAALPGEPHPLSAYSACAVSGSSVYTAVSHFSSSEDSLGSFDHSTVYKTDLTTGQTYEMYRTGKPTVSSYIMRSGERRVVYSAPIAPVEIDGTTYTSLAVSYRNKTIEELIGGSAYGGQSDCYIIHPDGDVMLSEEPKSEIEDWMDNLFDYLQKHAQVMQAH